MRVYDTRQRRMIAEYLAGRAHDSVPVSEIVSAAAEAGVSASAVYRNLAQMEKDGTVVRTVAAGERSARYRYVDRERCGGSLHIACLKCGRLSHVPAELGERLSEALRSSEGFEVDGKETVIYGICGRCGK